MTSLSKMGSVPARIFLAIEVPDAVKADLGRLTGKLSPCAPQVRLVPPALLHLTVRFLGEISVQQVGLVTEASRVAVADISKFSLALARVGTFLTRSGRLRVIWIGLQPGQGLVMLQRLAAAVERELIAVGFPEEARSFSPHLTLARVRPEISLPEEDRLKDCIARLTREHPIRRSFQVEHLTVMRSDFGRGGHHYTPLATFKLACPGHER